MPSEWENNLSSSSAKVSSSSGSSLSASSSTATSPEPNSNGNNNNNNDSAKNGHAKDCAIKASTMSQDPTPYVARARVTRPTPPKPSTNPMQFVQIKPCNLYQSAQQQLKKVEEIKKVKEVIKEEPEDWQNNLDNWKSSRRKRVEHIIERVVEVKKLELEEHDRTRRKSKTFSEMMEERGERGRTRPKLQSLASYNEDEANDLSDLGIGTSSASGKSSISEDCEVHSIVSEPPGVEHLSSYDIENNSCQPCQDNLDRISSLGGYETSSTAPITSSPDPSSYEYTYEGAIEDYKSRVSKASAAGSIYNNKKSEFDRKLSSNFNDQINDIEETSSITTIKKEDLPKIDISKKRELFENQETAMQSNHEQQQQQMEKKRIPSEFANVRSIKDRLCSLEKKPTETNNVDDHQTIMSASMTNEILPGEVYSIKERMQCLKQQQTNSVNSKPNINKVVAEVVAVPPLKDRLSSLQNAVTKEEIIKKPVVLVDEYQLEMLKNEDMARRQLEITSKDESIIVVEKAPSDDSGINTTDEKIDQEPATTDDEDDEITGAMTSSVLHPKKSEEKLSSAAAAVATIAAPSNNEFQGDLDSSVSVLKSNNLNSPIVVSLVDKPVDHGVVSGSVSAGGGCGSGDIVKPKDEESSEVNHAQNLLKMFKLAFNDENDIDVINDSVKSDQVEVELDTRKFNIVAKKLPENVVQKPSETQQENDPAKAEKVCKKTAPTSPRLGLRSPTTNSNVILNIDNSQNKLSNNQVTSDSPEDPSYVRTSVSSKIQQLNKISSDSPKIPLPVSEKSPIQNKTQSKMHPSSPILIRSPTIEDQGSEKSPNQNKLQSNRSPSSPILIRSSTIDHEGKSPNQNKPQSDMAPSSPILIRSPTTEHEPSESPPKFVSVSATVQQLNSLSSPSQEKPKLLEISRTKSPKSDSSAVSPINSQKSPIYENISMSPQNQMAQCKKISNSDNNGRVEIFNSKSMPAKPKSPEVLPRIVKNDSSNVESKNVQQSALNEFIKDLETAVIVDQTNAPINNNLKAQNDKSQISKKSDKFVQPLETKPIPIPQNPEKNSQPNSPLPLDACVDILQSFLAAERAPKQNRPVESPIVKSPKESNSHRSDNFARLESVIEVPCSKLDVKDLPDPNFIRTPCINVNCQDDVLTKESVGNAQSLVRDSVSSAGDSSPSSDITVIFKSPTPESPKPNKSTLMEIAQRMGSPIATRRDPLAQRHDKKPICEKPCLKINVKDLPDPNFIRTECIDVDRKACCSDTPLTPSTPGLALQKTNTDILKKTCEDVSNSPPLSPILGGRQAEKPNFMIARVEVVETKIKVTTTNDAEVPPAVPTTAPPPIPPSSPKTKPKSAQNSKPKNIFEFLKKNFQSKSETSSAAVDEFEPISVDNSKFYVPSDVISPTAGNSSSNKDTNGVNIEITKKITSDAIVEQTDTDLNLTDEINDILDEEISKLVVEDAKL